jgi:hypothetical protein
MEAAYEPQTLQEAIVYFAGPVVLSTEQQTMLESRARARSASARSVERARIVSFHCKDDAPMIIVTISARTTLAGVRAVHRCASVVQ